ncbi:TetR/AcrR family transcriptional regulator [Pseudonocardia xishanensis]|uniref:HTH tetR-type domain-containing protein n=1 Tax=Pseudonocardia xishanensis TaxID=630995 RepID=A0ABP8RW20_9PSEU
MTDEVKPRRYHSPRRARQAADTRAAILAAARELLAAQGWAATTVAQVARRAEVSVDTVYASVGRKPQVLRALVETALSGTDEPVPGEQRDYVQRVLAASGARAKLRLYAAGIGALQQRLAPIFLALRDAAMTDPDCAALWREIAERRRVNMLRFAADLRATGELRADLSDEHVADVVWSMNAAEYWVLLVHERAWTPERFVEHLADTWSRTLLG